MLKKIFLTVAALCTAAAMNASVTAKASGKGASVQQTAPGVWVLSVAPGQGWSQIQLAAGKAPQWGNGKISVTVKVLEPAGKLPGITLSSEGPRTAINSSYIQNTLKCNEKVVLTAEHKGNQPPRYISISVKNSVVPVKLEISDVKFDTAAPAAPAHACGPRERA